MCLELRYCWGETKKFGEGEKAQTCCMQSQLPVKLKREARNWIGVGVVWSHLDFAAIKRTGVFCSTRVCLKYRRMASSWYAGSNLHNGSAAQPQHYRLGGDTQSKAQGARKRVATGGQWARGARRCSAGTSAAGGAAADVGAVAGPRGTSGGLTGRGGGSDTQERDSPG